MTFSSEQALQITQNLFGIKGSATRLPGEHDYNFYLKTDFATEYLLKISHSCEDKNIILMQNEALKWLNKKKQSFLYPQLQRTLAGDFVGSLNNNTHFVRLFEYIPETLFANASYHSNALLESLGSQVGELCKALNGFKHATAKRALKWDLLQWQWIRSQIFAIDDLNERKCVEYFIKQFDLKLMPVVSSLRKSVIHGDINNYNTLINISLDNVAGFIDFGDMVESATVCELAIALAYALMDKPDPMFAATHIIKGYHAVYPLLEQEVGVLFLLIAIRLCISVVNSAIRKKENPHDPYLVISEASAWRLLKVLREIDSEHALFFFKKACQKSEIQQQRQKYIGKNIGLSYNSPLHIVKGMGQYLFDEHGRQYLDCVNNVCHVGHCHPKVVAAGQKQMAQLNTNTRYLHEHLTRYAERLCATLPTSLEVCFFVCSGSEANELALRLAKTYTDRLGIAVMDHGYHGNTNTLIDISPYKFNGLGGRGKPDFVQVLALPTNLEIPKLNPNTAAFISESLISCGGQVILPEHYLKTVYAVVRHVGGVCIADEVQIGLGRVGTHFWGFETQGVVPDIVTMGKPLGNGHPMGAVVTTRAIADSFSNGMEYFNTFGGNPVSCAIGLSVLDVLFEENLQAHALHTGNYFKQKLNDLGTKYPLIKEVRGLGLFLGIELFDERYPPNQQKELAASIVNRMQEKGILLSTDGPLHNVIKIKPPLVFTKENCDFVISNLETVIKMI